MYILKLTLKYKGINMNVTIGTYDDKNDIVHEVRAYKHIPLWVVNVYNAAMSNGVYIPTRLIICTRTHFKRSNKFGAYIYKGKTVQSDGTPEIIDAAALFTYKMPIKMKMYTLAHEIGHCDHHRRGIEFETTEEYEYYAHTVAELLTGFHIDNEKRPVD